MDCIEWPGRTTSLGYGLISVRGSNGNRAVYAHRFMYEAVNGPIPSGYVVRHECDNPTCVNPRHLTVGTQADNLADAKARGRLGPNRARSVILEEDIPVIRQRVSAGETQTAVATDYGVSVTTISNIARRKTWADVN